MVTGSRKRKFSLLVPVIMALWHWFQARSARHHTWGCEKRPP